MSDGEESVLIDVLGDDPFIRIVDTLLDHPTAEYTKKQLAEVNDVSRPTIYNAWDRVERHNIVEESRKIGNTTLYRLNSDSEIVEAFFEFDAALQQAKGDTDN